MVILALVFRDLLTITINLARSQKNALVIFLGDSSHSGVHVAQKKEADCGENHYEFSNPEGRVPAVLFSNRVEGESCHKSSDCRKKGEMVKVQSLLEGLTVETYRLPSVPRLHEKSHRNLKVRFRWLSPQTMKLDHKKKTQTWRRARGSRSGWEIFPLLKGFYSIRANRVFQRFT